MANKALLYRSNSKGHIAAAFTTAVVIHASAVALASFHHQALPVPPVPFSEIDFISDPETQETPPQEIETPVAPQPDAPNEFVEQDVPRQPRTKRIVTPIRPATMPGHTAISARPAAVHAPRPDYPYEARSHGITGSGIALLSINPLTGSVSSATMIQSTGNSILDNSATSAFRRWRFKSGTPSPVRVPITFTLTGAQL